MRAIVACLLVGIFVIAFNVGFFFWVQIQGVRTNLGLVEYVSQQYSQNPQWINLYVISHLVLLFLWPALFCYSVHKHDRQLVGMIKQMIVGWLILVIFISIIAALVLLSLFHEGRLGEIASFLMSLLCTPFTMEFLLCVIGAGLVISLNAVRLRLMGDEFVEIEVDE